MVKEEILEWLNGKNGDKYRRVLEFCCEPQAYDERKWEKGTKCSLSEMFEVIKDMKEAGGMVFLGDRKWQTTDLAKTLLSSPSP